MKLAFFDVDGTLSAPLYIDENGKKVIGFTPDGWSSFCKRAGEDGYKYCGIIPGVKEYARRLQQEGCLLFVLTSHLEEEETIAKRKFVGERYPGFFTDFFFVREDLEKVTVIMEVAKKYGVKPSDCALIEDTLNTLLYAHAQGIQAIHISNILADNITG